jgi:hypothetical protein
MNGSAAARPARPATAVACGGRTASGAVFGRRMASRVSVGPALVRGCSGDAETGWRSLPFSQSPRCETPANEARPRRTSAAPAVRGADRPMGAPWRLTADGARAGGEASTWARASPGGCASRHRHDVRHGSQLDAFYAAFAGPVQPVATGAPPRPRRRSPHSRHRPDQQAWRDASSVRSSCDRLGDLRSSSRGGARPNPLMLRASPRSNFPRGSWPWALPSLSARS